MAGNQGVRVWPETRESGCDRKPGSQGMAGNHGVRVWLETKSRGVAGNQGSGRGLKDLGRGLKP